MATYRKVTSFQEGRTYIIGNILSSALYLVETNVSSKHLTVSKYGSASSAPDTITTTATDVLWTYTNHQLIPLGTSNHLILTNSSNNEKFAFSSTQTQDWYYDGSSQHLYTNYNSTIYYFFMYDWVLGRDIRVRDNPSTQVNYYKFPIYEKEVPPISYKIYYRGIEIRSGSVVPPQNVIYNGASIGTIETGTDLTLHCAGKMMKSDISMGTETLQCNSKYMEDNLRIVGS